MHPGNAGLLSIKSATLQIHDEFGATRWSRNHMMEMTP